MEDYRRAGVPCARRRFLVGAAMAMAGPGVARAIGVDADSAFGRAASARKGARHAERAGSREAVDLYYQGAVFAYAAMAAGSADRAAGVYNECLAGCLRSATRHGAIDPRSHLVVQTPRGAASVPIVHRGFVWSPADFHALHEPADAPRNPANTRDHTRQGFGSPQVVRRANVRATADDAFIPDPTYFPATAVLRPDLGAWMGSGGVGGDVLEFYDPFRVGCVPVDGGARPLASDLDAPMAYLEDAGCGLDSGWAGLINPSQDVNRASLSLLEPFQPGKIPLVFVHGLYDSPWTFTDMMNALRQKPGFLDRYQVLGYRYATGLTFLHAAALFRRDLQRFAWALDPASTDPGVQNTVLIGHSMGGLLLKLQLISSGPCFWNLVATRPPSALATTQEGRDFLSALFFFDPVPTVRRAIFLAAPHDGLSAAAQPGGVLSERLTRRPMDLAPLVAQLERDNPGAIRSYMDDLPNSIGMLRRREPLLAAMRSRPIDPAIRFHTVTGTAKMPAAIAHGDGVVPIASAHHDGAASETLVPEFHTTINSSDYTLVEVDRILREHASGGS